MVQMDPDLPRREYPEVSFTALGHIVGFLVGIRPRASEGVVETKSRLAVPVEWAEVRHVPALRNVIDVYHSGRGETRLGNESGGPLRWRAVFHGEHEVLVVDGHEVPATVRLADGEGPESWVEVEVEPGGEVVVRVVENG
jgi:hypothetical protein